MFDATDTPGFAPHPLLRGFHAQTIGAAVWPRRAPTLRRVGGVPRRFRVSGRDEVVGLCHWLPRAPQAPPPPARRPTLLLVHGVTGSAHSASMLGVADKACAAGFDVVRLNLRNCGDTADLCSTLYGGALEHDVRAVADELAARDGCSSIVLCGYSLGGNVVLRVAGAAGSAPPSWLAGVVTVCAALDLGACADSVDRHAELAGYRRLLLKGLKQTLHARARLDPQRYDLRRLSEVSTLRAFDDRYTAPDFGFSGAHDYYARASALPLLPEISVPTLLIASRDDAFVPHEVFEHPLVKGARHVKHLLTASGGHCGFVGAGAAPVPGPVPAHCAGPGPAGLPAGPDVGPDTAQGRPVRTARDGTHQAARPPASDRTDAPARDTDRFWAEHRVVQFARQVAGLCCSAPGARSLPHEE